MLEYVPPPALSGLQTNLAETTSNQQPSHAIIDCPWSKSITSDDDDEETTIAEKKTSAVCNYSIVIQAV